MIGLSSELENILQAIAFGVALVIVLSLVFFLFRAAYRRDKRVLGKEYEKYVKESIDSLKFKRIDDARYVIYGVHFKIINPIAKKKELYNCEGKIWDVYSLKCGFQEVEDTVIYATNILRMYVGYSRFHKRLSRLLKVLESIVAIITFFVTMYYSEGKLPGGIIIHVIFLVLTIANYALLMLINICYFVCSKLENT